MSLTLMGKKRGMLQVFDAKGNIVTCTIIEMEPNVVTQIKTVETDGYNALQLGFDKVTVQDERTIENRVSKPLRGHFKKAGVDPRRHLAESRLETVDGYTIGQEIKVDTFADIAYVDVTGTSKGKGFQGVMKLHNFSGGPASHGSSFHRHAGSIGMRTTPGRCFPNSPRPSHMGVDTVTVQSLPVHAIYQEDNTILVRGAIPGPTGGVVYVKPATKRKKKLSSGV